MISGLAAGADTICAEEALAAQLILCALLPAPLSRYEGDFSCEQRSRLHALVQRAAVVRVLDDELARGYVRVGEAIARDSHLVIALWDGNESRGSGGTGDVVSMRLDGTSLDARFARLGIDVDAFIDVGPVVTIPTQRADGTPAMSEFETTYPKRFTGDSAAQRDFEAGIKRLERLNSDLKTVAAALSRTDALNELSNSLQRRIRSITNALYLLAGATAVVQILNVDVVVRTLLFAAAFVIYTLAKRIGFEERYQEYRALSEALRVRDVWRGAGIDIPIEAEFLRLRHNELQWIPSAMRAIDFVDPIHSASPSDPFGGPAAVWFDGQLSYYERSRKRENDRSKRIGLFGKLSLITGAIIAFGSPWVRELAKYFGTISTPTAVMLGARSQTALLLVGADGALIVGYGEKRGFSKNANRYEQMLFVFETIKRRKAKLLPSDTSGAQELVMSVGRESLTEHADWLLQCRDRPLTIPK